jgi:hypothetical protein
VTLDTILILASIALSATAIWLLAHPCPRAAAKTLSKRATSSKAKTKAVHAELKRAVGR